MNADLHALAVGLADYALRHSRPHLAPLLIALREQRIHHALIVPGPAVSAVEFNRPTVVTVSDVPSVGPAGFSEPMLDVAFSSASAIVIVAAPDEVRPYEVAAQASVEQGMHVVLVETEMRNEIAWLEYARSINPNIKHFVWTYLPQGRA